MTLDDEREPTSRVVAELRGATTHRGSMGATPGIVLTVENGGPVVITPVHGQGSPGRSRLRRHAGSFRASTQGHRGSLPDGPAGVSRSQSMRSARRPQSVDPTQRFRQRLSSIPTDVLPFADPQWAASNHSLPLLDDEAEVQRLRNFATTSKGIVNRGDSFRSKSRSAHSVASYRGSVQHLAPPTDGELVPEPEIVASSAAELPLEAAGLEAAAPPAVKHRVLVVGGPDVGKTALVRQFTTSEYICAYDSSQDEDNEKQVSVVLNGEESEMVFMEHSFMGDMHTNFVPQYSADGYVVVYSVTDKKSLQQAKEVLKVLHKWDDMERKAAILVGNKTDLVRLRVLSTDEGRSLAIEQGSKFIETSAGINHQVDELLAGTLCQIRLKMEQNLKRDPGGKRCAGCAGCKAKGIIKRILKKACSRSKSCDNLHVL